jgi:hypothetical protein
MKALKFIAAVILALHGLIHLMGTAAYLKLAEVQDLAYKTTVLGGRWDLGEVGIGIFGVLWGVAAIGFVVTPLAWLMNRKWWRPALVAVTLLSLLTILDWETAKTGVAVNLASLAVLWLWPIFAAKSREIKPAVRG